MRRKILSGSRRNVIVALLIAAAAAGCKREDLRSFQGVTEVEYIRLTAPHAGNLSTLAVKRGTRVAEGTQVFSLAEAGEIAAQKEASKRLAEVERHRKGSAPDPVMVENLKAQVAEAEWKLAQKSANAPVDGVVTETLYAKGDWVPAGAPVVAILPVDRIKVRFEVPLEVASHLQHGRTVTLICERCDETVEATVIYISPFAQPGVNGENVEALRYLVEARPKPAQAALLRPGLPVTVIL